MAYTKPLLALPIAITAPASRHIRVTFSNSSIGAATLDATLTTATYYNHRQSTGDSLGAEIIAELNTAEAALFGGAAGTWSTLTLTTGLAHRQAVKRSAGHANDTITSLVFSEPTTGLSGAIVGYSSDTVVPTAGSPGATYEFTGTRQRGRVWSPRVIATRQEQRPRRVVRSAVSPFDFSSIVSTYTTASASKRYEILVPAVPGVLVWQYLASISEFVATVSGLVSGDTNVCLETLWSDHGSLAPIRYLPDEDTPATYDEIEVVDQDWLEDLSSGLEEAGGGAPLLYDVRIPAQEYVA